MFMPSSRPKAGRATRNVADANHADAAGSTPGTKKAADKARDLWKSLLVR